MHPKFLSAVDLACFIGLILGIAGISITDDNASSFYANALGQGGHGNFSSCLCRDIAITSWLFTQLRSRLSIFQKKLFYAIIFFGHSC